MALGSEGAGRRAEGEGGPRRARRLETSTPRQPISAHNDTVQHEARPVIDCQSTTTTTTTAAKQTALVRLSPLTKAADTRRRKRRYNGRRIEQRTEGGGARPRRLLGWRHPARRERYAAGRDQPTAPSPLSQPSQRARDGRRRRRSVGRRRKRRSIRRRHATSETAATQLPITSGRLGGRRSRGDFSPSRGQSVEIDSAGEPNDDGHRGDWAAGPMVVVLLTVGRG